MGDAVGAQAPELTLPLPDRLRYLTKDVIDALDYMGRPLDDMVRAVTFARKMTIIEKPKRAARAGVKRIVVHLKPHCTVSLRSRAAVSTKRQVCLRSRAWRAANGKAC